MKQREILDLLARRHQAEYGRMANRVRSGGLPEKTKDGGAGAVESGTETQPTIPRVL